MKKIWIAVGVVSALTLAGCGGGRENANQTSGDRCPSRRFRLLI